MGIFAQLTDDLNIKYNNGNHNSSASSFINLGWNPSGPGDFPVLRFCNNFLTSSIENSSGICCTVCFSSKLMKSPSGSFVNTLAKYLFKMFAFSLLLSIKLLAVSLGLTCKLDTVNFDFVLDLMYFQNAFGFF